ncbi:hypothetical protein BGZ65_011746, partial [Modicella reniformis]
MSNSAVETITLDDGSKLEVYVAQRLGDGGQAYVYRGMIEKGGTKEKVAVKISKGGASIPEITQESAMLDLVNSSKHIIKKKAFKVGGLAFLALELADDGDLYTATTPPNQLGADVKLKYMLQIAHGLKELHEKNIVHGDLKAANVFICKKFGIVRILKIGDLGSAYVAGTEYSSRNANGMCIDPAQFPDPRPATPPAPTMSTDMYSFAMTIKQLYGLRVGQDPETSFEALKVPSDYIALLQSCMAQTNRPTADQ